MKLELITIGLLAIFVAAFAYVSSSQDTIGGERMERRRM